MPLLHDKVVRTMRLYPARKGGVPLAALVHPLSILVDVVAGEMGSAPMTPNVGGEALQANVGALLYYTYAEVVERGRPTNNGIQALATDVRNQLVYADPVAARESAEEARKMAALPMGSGTSAALLKIAERFDKDASINEERAKGKDTATVVKQISFSKDFLVFKSQWDDYYDLVVKNKAPGSITSLNIADTIDSFDARYRQYVAAFEKVGGALTTPPPAKSNAGDEGFEIPSLKNIGDGVSGIVKPIVYGGIAIGGVLLAASLYRSREHSV